MTSVSKSRVTRWQLVTRSHLARLAVFFVTVFGIMLFAGCARGGSSGAAPQGAPVAPAHLEHVVRYRGETFGTIARWYTGSAANWSAIAAANPNVNPNKITIGRKINIPTQIVTRQEPLPESFVRQVAPKSATPKKDTVETIDSATPSAEPGAVETAAPSGDVAKGSDTEAVSDVSEPGTPGQDQEPNATGAVEGSVGSLDAGSTPSAASPSDDTAIQNSVPVNTGDANTGDAVNIGNAANTGGAVKPAKADDLERERLLDELLKNQ